MPREQKEHREQNSPSYRSHNSPRADRNGACPTDEKAGAPSSASESRTKDAHGCTKQQVENAPPVQVASKDEHEKSVG